MKKIEIVRYWQRCVSGAFLAVLSCSVSAATPMYKIQYAKVIDSYGSCSWKNNGNGTSTISLDVNYRPITGNLGVDSKGEPRGDNVFSSRGVLVYTYDSTGKLRPSSNAALYVAMNGTRQSGSYTGKNYVMYYGSSSLKPLPGWDNKDAHRATFEIMIDNSVISDWPGVAIRAGNYTSGDDVGESTGGAYVSNIGGACKVIDPEIKPPEPPPVIEVDMAAPDWDLGELPRGDGEKTLDLATERFCLRYSGDKSSQQRFVINATSANGIVNKRYRLRNTDPSKSTHTVPYDITLDSGSAQFSLPNEAGNPVTLDKSVRTCFTPTFKTSVGESTESGDYSDVLSFTVVTKS